MKRISFSLLSAVLALISALSSAFTVAPRIGTPYLFYNTNIGTKSTNRFDYIYRGGIVGPNCASNNNSYCKAIWTQIFTPAINSSPSSTAIIKTVYFGNYNGL